MPENKPADTLRMGALKATIWRNSGKDGATFYNVVFSRSYKDAQDQWKESDSFGFDDLLSLSKLADLAHTRVYKLRGEDKKPAEGRK